MTDKMQHQHHVFGLHLQQFVERWKPEHPEDVYRFQMDLMNLFADAMRSQNITFSAGINMYASQVYEQASLRPLGMIFREEKK